MLTGKYFPNGSLDLPSCPTNIIALSLPILYTYTAQYFLYLVKVFTQCWYSCCLLIVCNLMLQQKLKRPFIFPAELTTALLGTNCNQIVSIDVILGISINFPEDISLRRDFVDFLVKSGINVTTNHIEHLHHLYADALFYNHHFVELMRIFRSMC